MPKNQPINRSLSPPTLKTTKIFEPLEKTREKQIKSRQRTNTTTHTVLEGNFYVSQYVGAYKKAQNYHYNPPQKKSSQICQICQQKKINPTRAPRSYTPLATTTQLIYPLNSPLQNMRMIRYRIIIEHPTTRTNH